MSEWWPDLLASAVSLDARDDRQSASSDALRRAQRAWESFAEAECGYAYALWGRSDFRNVAKADCEMRTLARRAWLRRPAVGSDDVRASGRWRWCAQVAALVHVEMCSPTEASPQPG